MFNKWLAIGGVAAAVTIAGCGSSSSSSSPSSGGTSSTPAASAPASPGSSAPAGVAIKTAKTKIGTVLTDAAGKTLYYFVIDTKTTSNCNGACATFWPPVKGPAAAASGTSLAGTFGVITRKDGSKQASYDGHPLYTFAGDKAPGDTTGNGKNLSGGLWFAITPAGGKPGSPGPQPSSSKSSSGGGGYGY